MQRGGKGGGPTKLAVQQQDLPMVAEPVSKDPLQRSRNVLLMDEAELRTYALQIGMTRRDSESLAVPRLQQNCLTHLNRLIEEI